MKHTKIINLISWPWVWKSVLAASLFVEMKINGYNVEYVQEYAKTLIWTKDFETLNNQYFVSNQQYKLFNSMIGKVDYIITDWSLIHWIYYNRINPDNTSDIWKTEEKIKEYISSFDNINIFLERNVDIKYEIEGRLQDLEESISADSAIKTILIENNYEFKEILSSLDSVNEIFEYIKNKNASL